MLFPRFPRFPPFPRFRTGGGVGLKRGNHLQPKFRPAHEFLRIDTYFLPHENEWSEFHEEIINIIVPKTTIFMFRLIGFKGPLVRPSTLEEQGNPDKSVPWSRKRLRTGNRPLPCPIESFNLAMMRLWDMGLLIDLPRRSLFITYERIFIHKNLYMIELTRCLGIMHKIRPHKLLGKGPITL